MCCGTSTGHGPRTGGERDLVDHCQGQSASQRQGKVRPRRNERYNNWQSRRERLHPSMPKKSGAPAPMGFAEPCGNCVRARGKTKNGLVFLLNTFTRGRVVHGGGEEQTVSSELGSPVVSCSPAVFCLASACVGAVPVPVARGCEKRRVRKFSRLASAIGSVSLRVPALPPCVLLACRLWPCFRLCCSRACACGTGFAKDRKCFNRVCACPRGRTEQRPLPAPRAGFRVAVADRRRT